MKLFPTLSALALLALAGGAIAASPAQPLQLRSIMDQMQADTDALVGGMAQQNWSAVAQPAERLQHHAEPPITEKIRILGWLFTDAPTFRNYDLQVKAAAGEIAAAAQQQDAAAARSAYQRMQQSCDGCHHSFRAPFLERFYGAR